MYLPGDYYLFPLVQTTEAQRLIVGILTTEHLNNEYEYLYDHVARLSAVNVR